MAGIALTKGAALPNYALPVPVVAFYIHWLVSRGNYQLPGQAFLAGFAAASYLVATSSMEHG